MKYLRLTLAGCLLAATAASAQPAGPEMMQMMEKNHQQMMAMKPSGETDVDFAMMMRMHHLAGIQMAETEVKHGKDAKMKAMARKIIAAQKKEIAQLDAFLEKRGHAAGHAHGAKK